MNGLNCCLATALEMGPSLPENTLASVPNESLAATCLFNPPGVHFVPWQASKLFSQGRTVTCPPPLGMPPLGPNILGGFGIKAKFSPGGGGAQPASYLVSGLPVTPLGIRFDGVYKSACLQPQNQKKMQLQCGGKVSDNVSAAVCQ